MIRFCKGVLKTIAALIAAVAILSGLMCLYSLTPVHADNPNGNTDYVWSANSVWVKATEAWRSGVTTPRASITRK